MKIILSNMIVIHYPSKELINWCKQTLVVKNPEYQKRVQLGYYVGKTPKSIYLYHYDYYEDVLQLPSGCLASVKQFIKDNDTIIDSRSTPKASIKSNITLRNYQKPSAFICRHQDSGLIISFCGSGKTQMALELAAKMGLKTLFITHTQDLVQQAYDRCEECLECTKSYIKEGKVDYSGDITFALVQTLVKNLNKIPQDKFGLVIVDECHRTAVNASSIGMFRECIEYFAAKHKVGLSATLSRSDGLEYCIPYIIGDIVYEIKEDNVNNKYVGIFEGEEIIRFDKGLFQTPVVIHPIRTDYSLLDKKGVYKDVFDRNGMTISFSKLINDIASDKERNDMIAKLVNGLSGSTIILSDRVGQLEYLKDKIKNSVEIDGNTKKDAREKAIDDIKKGKKKVLLASYKIAKEGLDCKILQNVVFATPVKDYSVVVQCIGRCQRPYEGKDIAHVYDLIDDVKNLNRFWSERRKIYKKMNYSYEGD